MEDQEGLGGRGPIWQKQGRGFCLVTLPGLGCTVETLNVKLTSSLAAFRRSPPAQSTSQRHQRSRNISTPIHSSPPTHGISPRHRRDVLSQKLINFPGSSSGTESGPSQPPRPLAQADSVAQGLSWGLPEPQATASHLVRKGGGGYSNYLVAVSLIDNLILVL